MKEIYSRETDWGKVSVEFRKVQVGNKRFYSAVQVVRNDDLRKEFPVHGFRSEEGKKRPEKVVEEKFEKGGLVEALDFLSDSEDWELYVSKVEQILFGDPVKEEIEFEVVEA